METTSLFNRWSYYRKKYGMLHAAVAFVGRQWNFVWRLLGPSVSRRYLAHWLKTTKGKRILNLGGGSNVRKEWLTADIDPRADVYMDLTRPLPLEDSSIDVVVLEEVIEHFSFEDGRSILTECHRILRSDGLIRVSTPDLRWIFDQWQKKKPLPEGIVMLEAERILGSHVEDKFLNIAALNAIFYAHGHCFIYDATSLASQLSAVGFTGIRFGNYQERISPVASYDSHADRFWHPPEMSMYAEAHKRVISRVAHAASSSVAQ